MTLNCALTISNYISSMFEVHGASRNDLYFQVTVDIHVSNLESVFPSTYVLMIHWFTVGWLMLIVTFLVTFI